MLFPFPLLEDEDKIGKQHPSSTCSVGSGLYFKNSLDLVCKAAFP